MILNPIIVFQGDGIEFVIVTFRASERDAEECLSDGVGDVVERFLPALFQVDCVVLDWIVAKKSSRDDRPFPGSFQHHKAEKL